MIRIIKIAFALLIGVTLTSCGGKEELYSVQGTVTDYETHEPLAGINVDILEDGHFYSSQNKAETDSNGQFIVHLESERDEVYVFFSQKVESGTYYGPEYRSYSAKNVIKTAGTTTIESEFKQITACNIIFFNNGYFAEPYNKISATILNPDVIYHGSATADVNVSYSNNWAYEPLLVYSGNYIHYEMLLENTGYGLERLVRDSIYVPHSAELFADTIYH